jgi:hypothetical protein
MDGIIAVFQVSLSFVLIIMPIAISQRYLENFYIKYFKNGATYINITISRI